VELKTACEIGDYTVKLRLAHPGGPAAGRPQEKSAARGCRQRFSGEGAKQVDQVIGWLIAMIQ
jgi:hypothetical protein